MICEVNSYELKTMDNFSNEEENKDKDINEDGGYKRFSLSDSRMNSMSFLPSFENGDEFILHNIKQPSLSSVNMSDSLDSTTTLSSNFNTCIEMEGTLELTGDLKDYKDVMNYLNVHPIKEDYLRQSTTLKEFVDSGYKEDFNSENSFDKYHTSSPIQSLCASRKFASISLQDVSTIDLFPLESKTTNAFSTETIQTQSMSSTTKSKDSGFQRSASCLSLNSGNRSYEHVQSKVKQYIKDIKDSEAKRKKEKLNSSNDISKALPDGRHVIVNVLGASTDQHTDVFIAQLKDELKEKDTILNELQQNYNTLLGKYAEAINQIDVLRVRSSLNYDYYLNDNNDVQCSRNYSASISDNSPIRNKTFHKNQETVCYNKMNNNDIIEAAVEDDRTVRESNHVDNSNEHVYINNDNTLCDVNVRDVSLNELQPPSTTHSSSLKTVSSVKSTQLGPINRMYSSSFRLDKKFSPLLSSKSIKANSVLFNNGRQNVQLHNNTHNCSGSQVVAQSESQGNIILNNNVSYSSNTLVDNKNNSKVPSNIFEKVRKWQVSLPTGELVRSHSSSTIDSTENLDIEPSKFRRNSLDSKLNEDNLYSNHFKVRGKETRKVKVRKLGKEKRRLICKSDQNILSPNNNRCGTEKTDVCKSSDNMKSRTNSSRNNFKRSYAFDKNSQENVIGKDASLLDESTSLSSSILSSLEDDLNITIQDPHNFAGYSIPIKTNHSSGEIVNNSLTVNCRKASNINIGEVFNGQTQENKELVNNKKCDKHPPWKSQDLDKGHPIKKIAWGCTNREIFALKNQPKTESNSLLQIRKASFKKLKSYTNVLKATGVNSASVVDVGTQVSIEDCERCPTKSTSSLDLGETGASTYIQDLNAMNKGVNYMKQELERICEHLDQIHTSVRKSLNEGSTS